MKCSQFVYQQKTNKEFLHQLSRHQNRNPFLNQTGWKNEKCKINLKTIWQKRLQWTEQNHRNQQTDDALESMETEASSISKIEQWRYQSKDITFNMNSQLAFRLGYKLNKPNWHIRYNSVLQSTSKNSRWDCGYLWRNEDDDDDDQRKYKREKGIAIKWLHRNRILPENNRRE